METVEQGGEDSSTMSSVILAHATKLLTSEGSISRIIDVISMIILEYAGANRGFIFFFENEQLYLLAKWGTGEDSKLVVYSLPQENAAKEEEEEETPKNPSKLATEIRDLIPYSLIREVAHGNTTGSPYEYFDEYQFASQVQSVTCIPMKHGGKITGVLYLENTLTSGAFPRHQHLLLEHLASQIGASIERTCLHRQMKKILAELQKQNQMLIMLDRLKDEIITNTSHELRTPLNAILGFTQTLQDTNLDTEQSEHCSMINSSAEGLLAVINDIIDLQQYQQNKLISIQRSHFELRGELDKIIRMVPLEDKPIAINCHWGSSLPPRLWLEGDQERLKQVLVNLLSNSIKFTNQGNIILRVIQQKSNLQKENEILLRFEVQDTGIGIHEDFRANIFKPFSQADSSSMRQYQGAGLGLAISQNIVQSLSDHKSSIEFESTVGIGSVFSFELKFKRITQEIPMEEPTETIRFADAISNSHIAYVGNNKFTKQSFIDDLREINNLHYTFVNDLDEYSKILNNRLAAKDKSKWPEFCVIDTECFSVSEFERLFGLSKFLSQYRDLHAAHKLYFVLLTPVTQRNNFHTFLTDSLENFSVDHFWPIISCPMLKNAVVTALGHLLVSTSNPPAITIRTRSNPIALNGPKKVIMFEDNKMNQRVQERFLKCFGIQCETMENGKKGCDYLFSDDKSRLNEFDLVLMDCHMPVMDGFEATKKIRSMEEALGLPRKHIVAITAGQSFEECYSAGMCGVVTKPIKKNSLGKILSRYFDCKCCDSCKEKNFCQ